MTNRIALEDILSPEDCRIIDTASSPPGDTKVLSSLAEVLRDRFGLVLELDPDIISGLIVDSSNLPVIKLVKHTLSGITKLMNAPSCPIISKIFPYFT